MKTALFLLSAITMTGCARFQPQPLSPETTAAAFEERSLNDAGLHRFAAAHPPTAPISWPPAQWDLESLTLAAIYFSPEIAVARVNADSVSAGKTTAAQRPNPSLTVNPAYNVTHGVPSPWLVTASLDVPIETAGKRSYRMAQAAHLSEAARLSVATVAWETRLRLRRALIELWAAEESARLLDQQQAAQDSIVHLLEDEIAAGALSPTAAARERIALEQTRLARLEAESRRDQARIQLAAAIGLPAQAMVATVISFSAFNDAPRDLPEASARRCAMLGRSDILSALAEYAAAEAALQLEIAKQYPDLHLSPGYEFDQGDNKWGLGLGMTLPLLNQNQGPIAEAEARRREKAVKFQTLQARVIGEIDTALAACWNARQKLTTAAALLDQAQQQERTARAMTEAGEVGAQALAAAKLEVAAAALSQLEARLKTQQAFATLEGALQASPEILESALATSEPTPDSP